MTPGARRESFRFIFQNRTSILQPSAGETSMWRKPVMIDIRLGAEINSYMSASQR
jgi:coenzyme PQQ precursor peptide PqqA